MLERRITENRMQKTEATNKMHDHMTQVNRLKARLQRLEKEFQAMEAEKKKLAG